MQIQGWGDGVRRTWADGRTQRLDRMVEDVATGLEAILAVRRLQREEREERERRYQERARRHALARQRAEREKKREAFLDQFMEVRREVEALEAWLARPGMTSEVVGSHARLIAWAMARLETLRQRFQPEDISEALDAEKLFPEPDELHDPLETSAKGPGCRLTSLLGRAEWRRGRPLSAWGRSVGATLLSGRQAVSRSARRRFIAVQSRCRWAPLRSRPR
jgi:hypothetical protein